MKHLTKFDNYNINELNKDSYDKLIGIGTNRDDPRGKRLMQNASALRAKQYGGKGLNFRLKDSETSFQLNLNPPTMQGHEQVIFKTNAEGMNPYTCDINGTLYTIDTINVGLTTTGLCKLWAYGNSGLGTKYLYTDRKGAGWITKEVCDLLEKGDYDYRISPNQIPQF